VFAVENQKDHELYLHNIHDSESYKTLQSTLENPNATHNQVYWIPSVKIVFDSRVDHYLSIFVGTSYLPHSSLWKKYYFLK
jgi:hypothetical protein